MVVKRRIWGGGKQAEAVPILHNRADAWYKANRTALRLQGKITIERLRTQGGWPKLKAKAAATRYLTLFCLELMLKYGEATEYDGMMTAVVQLLARFYEIVKNEGMFLNESIKAELPVLGQRPSLQLF